MRLSLDYAKFALAALALLVWAYGVRVDDARVRWVGIALLAIAFLLRFLRPRRGAE